MVRKLTALATMVVVVFALLPAVAAFAAPGSAALNGAARNVFPTAPGARQDFTVTVTNAAATGGILGVGASGQRIRFISAELPLNTRTAACGTVPADWVCSVINPPQGQPLVRLSTPGQGLASSASLPVNFSAIVNQPAVVNRSESIRVRLSADGQQFTTASGDTSFTVHGLELVQGITIDDTARETGANVYPDLRYTTGQIATASFDVVNRSEVPMAVTPTLNSRANGRVGQLVGANPDLAPGERRTYTFTLNTGSPAVSSGRELADLDGKATGAANGTTGDAVTITNGATANFTPTQLQIEAPATLTLAPASSTRVQGVLTRLAPFQDGVEVSIDATKANFPGVNLAAGQLPTQLTLSIPGCSNPTTGSCSVTAPLAKVTQNGNNIGTTLPRLNGGSANLTLHYVFNFTQLAVGNGNRVNLDAAFQFSGLDDNKFPFGPITNAIAGLLVIDLAAPILLLDGPVGTSNGPVTTRVADGDGVRVSGMVVHTDDLASMTVTLAATQDASNFTLPANQRVDANTNRYRQTVATQTNLGATTDCAAPYVGRRCQEFTVNITLPGNNNADREDIYAIGFGAGALINLSGSATDTAGNTGVGVPRPDGNGLLPDLLLGVDNDHPDVFPKRPRLAGGTTPVGMEALAFYITDSFYGPNPVVRVSFDAGSFPDLLEGGCTPNMWSVDGANVQEVRNNDNTACGQPRNPNATPPAYTNQNDRILILDGPISPATQTVNFSYVANGGTLGNIPQFFSPIRDAMNNRAYQQDGVIIDGRTPNVPVIDPAIVTRLATVRNNPNEERESVGVSFDTRGTPDLTDDFPILHTNVNDLRIPVTGFIAGTDDLQILEIDPATGAETQLARIPTTQGQNTLTIDQSTIQLATCGTDCQVRTHRAFRFIRVAQTADSAGNVSTYDIPGIAVRTDFLFDTAPLRANGTSLTLGGGTNGSDLVTVTFGGEPNSANEIRFFYRSDDEWRGLRTVVPASSQGSQDGVYASHPANNVFNTATEVSLDINYNGNQASSFYGTRYDQFLGPDMGFFIEDLAGNLMAANYEITKNGTRTEFQY